MKPIGTIESIKSQLNLNDDESEIFDMVMKDKSAQEISMCMGLSVRTVFRRISRIQEKLLQL